LPNAPLIWIPYCGMGPGPGDWLSRWNFDPLLGLGLLAGLFAWRQWGAHHERRSAFAASAVAAGLFFSPFCALGSALFTVRVIHDVILAAMLAPLIMRAFALQRRHIPGSVTLWTAAHAAIFLGWHAPTLYEAAMNSSPVFWVMQFTITGSAAVWWSRVLRAPPTKAVGALLAAMLAMGLLGAILTFALVPLYAPHFLTTAAWGLTPLEDQQLAGVIMWAPASLIYLIAALGILFRSLWPEPVR